MKILAIGDVVGGGAVRYLGEKLWGLRSSLGADLVIANGENATDVHGLSSADAQAILDAGVDVITLGNHTYGRRDLCVLLSDSQTIVRPANYPALAPGGGYTLCHVGGWRVLVINVLGTALMEPLACPFSTVDRILEREAGRYDLAVMDVHAEATSEKLALARWFDGRVQVIFGTHTHVQTADEQILPLGSGYITDLGMTGPKNGIIGSEAEAVIERFRTKMPVRFRAAEGEIEGRGALFTLDCEKKRVVRVERILF